MKTLTKNSLSLMKKDTTLSVAMFKNNDALLLDNKFNYDYNANLFANIDKDSRYFGGS